MNPKALELDDALADAHLALASIKKVYDWDEPAAEQGYKRALELGPNYAASHHGYADHLAATGRTQEAICEIVKAQELDTLSLAYGMEIAWNWFMAREYERALEQSFKTPEMDPLHTRVRVSVVQSLLGHTSPSTTMLYAHARRCQTERPGDD